ncbi:MAG: hypothetical protein AAGA18_01220 [Verrucomicrobiota bacterium]
MTPHTWSQEKKADDPDWTSGLSQKFYVRSRNEDLFARLEMTFLPSNKKTSKIRIKSYVNPNGSRNLEYDKAKDITKSFVYQ